MKNDPANRLRFVNELQYGIALLPQRKYSEAKRHLLIGYNGLRPDQERKPSTAEVGLSELIEQISSLREFSNTTLALLHNDPAIRAVVLDCGFPASPFAP